MALPLSAVTEVRADEDGRPVLVVRSEAPADDDSADNDGATVSQLHQPTRDGA